MGENTLLVTLVLLVSCGLVVLLVAWLFRRNSAAQQRQLHTLYGVAENMISARDPADIYRRIAHTLPPMLDATHCHLLLYNRITKQLDVMAGTDRFPVASLAMDSLSGPVTCFKNRAILEVPEAQNCPFLDAKIVERLGQKSMLLLPMISEDEVFGVIEVDDRRRKRTFTEEQKASAQYVANLGALALKLCEQRVMREQLYRTEKMAAVGELISGVAHELKSPLAALSGLSELAIARYGSGPLAHDLHALHSEARHAGSILQRLISFARPQRSGPTLVDLNTVLRSVVAMRKEKWESQGIRIHLQLSTAPPMVASDQSHLEQVFLNLLINAERALEGAREKVITARTTIVSKRVLIAISDTGPLFASDLQGRAYNPFFDPRKPIETAGLGLALCQSLIESHGGSIRVSNSPGHTTTFEIEYPLAEMPMLAPRALAEESRAAASLTALVIDEDRAVQDALLNLLSDRHYRVITVSSGEEALDLAERARFDLVLCDVRVRGMSGIELYRRVKHRIGSFVFLTADSFSADLKEMFSEPNQSVLTKPFTAADVEGLLGEIEPQLSKAAGIETRP